MGSCFSVTENGERVPDDALSFHGDLSFVGQNEVYMW